MVAADHLRSSARHFNVCCVGTCVGTLVVAVVLASSWWLSVARVLWISQRLIMDVQCREDLGWL